MELTLKRALKLRKELEGALTRVDLPTQVVVSILIEANITELPPPITEARQKFSERLTQYRLLSSTLARLRLDLTKANVESGVEELLAECGSVDRSISALRKITAARATPNGEELKAELAAARKNFDSVSSDAYRVPVKHLDVDIMSKEVQESSLEMLAQLRRHREALEDKRAWLNSTYKVTVTDEDTELLRKLAIL